MKISPLVLAAIVGCGVAFAATNLDRVNAQPRRPSTFLVPTHSVQARTHRTSARPHDERPCSSNSSSYFVGIADNDFAYGYDAGVVSGFQNFACDDYAAILGGTNNAIGAAGDNRVATLSGIGTGNLNNITNTESFIGAGTEAAISGAGAFIGAGGTETYAKCTCGPANDITATDAFIGAGDLNVISGNGSFIGGGGYTTASVNVSTPGNIITGVDSFIGAGDQNSIAATQAFVGSGNSNTISSAASYSAILGGLKNKVSGVYATVIGGYGNTASGSYAIVAGGNSDTASGILTYAAGYHAEAGHNGSFVWSDYVSGSSTIEDSATNQFIARASGGTTFYSNEGATSGVKLAAGSGTWASLSDRNAKTDIASLDDDAVLSKVVALPVRTWRYTSESGVRHAGPMAQDFYAAFGIGEDDRHITSIDEDGIALAAVKGLNAKLERKNAQVGRLQSEVDELRAELHRVEASLPHSSFANRRTRREIIEVPRVRRVATYVTR